MRKYLKLNNKILCPENEKRPAVRLGDYSVAGHSENRTILDVSKNVGEAVSARRKQAKKRSLRAVNEHFEPVFNAAMTTQVVFRGVHLR
jgi:hypothetical protein